MTNLVSIKNYIFSCNCILGSFLKQKSNLLYSLGDKLPIQQCIDCFCLFVLNTMYILPLSRIHFKEFIELCFSSPDPLHPCLTMY